LLRRYGNEQRDRASTVRHLERLPGGDTDEQTAGLLAQLANTDALHVLHRSTSTMATAFLGKGAVEIEKLHPVAIGAERVALQRKPSARRGVAVSGSPEGKPPEADPVRQAGTCERRRQQRRS
jgi:hypothetical protein